GSARGSTSRVTVIGVTLAAIRGSSTTEPEAERHDVTTALEEVEEVRARDVEGAVQERAKADAWSERDVPRVQADEGLFEVGGGADERALKQHEGDEIAVAMHPPHLEGPARDV